MNPPAYREPYTSYPCEHTAVRAHVRTDSLNPETGLTSRDHGETVADEGEIKGGMKR